MTATPSGGEFTTAEILEAARALGVLNSGSHAAPRILAVLCEPGAEAATIAEVIRQEPGITARVLRVANSAFYGFSGYIATIDRAVVVLGLDAVRGVAAAACLDRSMLRAGEAGPIDMDDLLKHCIAAAAAAEALARKHHRTLAAEAFIGGLLHDLGVILELRLNAAGVDATVSALHALHESGEGGEAQVGSHPECAAVLFEAWKLPAPLIAAARYHHEPARASEPHRPLAALVNLGNHLALECGIGFALEQAAPAHPGAALTLLGLTDEDLAAVREQLPARVAELQRTLADA